MYNQLVATKPTEQLQIQLRYEGPDVENGSMSVEDIIPVLQGFSSAYGKLATVDDPQSIHRIRITGVKPGSANIILEVWQFLGDNAAALGGASVVTTGAYFIVRKIWGAIKLKKHTQKKPFKEKINGTNSITVINSNNVEIVVPLELYELFKSKQIDGDLNKMMQPLEKDHIDSVELSATDPSGEILSERVSADERPYFDVELITATTTRETWLVVKLNSLTKSTNNGWAYLGDGSRIFYRYTGSNTSKLYNLFSYSGPLRVKCTAHMDENLKVIELEILDLEKTQEDLFDKSTLPENESDST